MHGLKSAILAILPEIVRLAGLAMPCQCSPPKTAFFSLIFQFFLFNISIFSYFLKYDPSCVITEKLKLMATIELYQMQSHGFDQTLKNYCTLIDFQPCLYLSDKQFSQLTKQISIKNAFYSLKCPCFSKDLNPLQQCLMFDSSYRLHQMLYYLSLVLLLFT